MLYSFAGLIKTLVDYYSFEGNETSEMPAITITSIDNSFSGTSTVELPTITIAA